MYYYQINHKTSLKYSVIHNKRSLLNYINNKILYHKTIPRITTRNIKMSYINTMKEFLS